MAANVKPIFVGKPAVQWTGLVTAANTAKDGTGTVDLVFTADSIYGSRLDYVKARAAGTNVATVARFFVNNGSTPTVAANNVLFMERTIAATTLSETSELLDNVIPMDLGLEPGQRLYVALGTAVSAGLRFTGVGGAYIPAE